MTDYANPLSLNDGRSIPRLGMGTWQLPDAQAPAIVRTGLDIGFRLVDTAAAYDNERGVGEGMTGSDAFLTTKLWNDRHQDAEAALDESLALLGRDSVDLYLIHWPVPAKDAFVDAWRAMIALRDAGKTRSIGVSNFEPEHLDSIIDATGVTPAVNQIELHPRFQQHGLRDYHEAHGIVTQSWSPLGRGDALDDPVITSIAERYHRSPAQVVIAWHLALGVSVIPKASGREHLSDNFAALDLALDDDDLAKIETLDDSEGGRIGPHPLKFG